MLESDCDHHYFVDEAGDLSLFNKRGESLLGTPGVSKTFMLGVAWLRDPADAALRLTELRNRLLADEILNTVPSMLPEAKKTAVAFHAKDDIQEVRAEVFRLIRSLQPRFWIAIRRKSSLIDLARTRHASGSRLNANEIYDDLVKRTFRDRLHKGDAIRISFARRGKRNRDEALSAALQAARKNFMKKHGEVDSPPLRVLSNVPSQDAGLQIADYGLWAVQRAFERDEWRYFEYLRDRYRLIIDLDDKRHKPYGTYYSDRNPLTSKKKKPVEG